MLETRTTRFQLKWELFWEMVRLQCLEIMHIYMSLLSFFKPDFVDLCQTLPAFRGQKRDILQF